MLTLKKYEYKQLIIEQFNLKRFPMGKKKHEITWYAF